MENFNSDEWVKKVRNGRVYYDRKDLDRPLPTMEEFILECFCEKYSFKDAKKFKQAEKEFLDTLSTEQKDQYFKVFEMLQQYRTDREKKLVEFARNWGKIVFD